MRCLCNVEYGSQPNPETFGLFRPSLSGLARDLDGGGEGRPIRTRMGMTRS